MYKYRRLSPECPKCKGHYTYDIIPGLPKESYIQMDEDVISNLKNVSIGNARYYCKSCDYTWKKYRGRKPYLLIKKIWASAGGYPEPSNAVEIDLENGVAKLSIFYPFGGGKETQSEKSITKEEASTFLEGLYKFDLINWSEEYTTSEPVMDGGYFSVRIEYDTHCEIKNGHIHFPDGWWKFCEAASKACGGKFY